MTSTILTNENQIRDLISLCEFQIDQKWNLIYRASQDGFKASEFHFKCNHIPNTLVIIRSKNGNVFGGYTEKSWYDDFWDLNKTKADPNSFIFSLINKLNKPIKIRSSQNQGIRCHNSYGPVFGGNEGHSDLVIADESNKSTYSYSYLGHYYTHPDFKYGSNEAETFLAGSYQFQVSEIEVYTMISYENISNLKLII
jgi:hypothetical protein